MASSHVFVVVLAMTLAHAFAQMSAPEDCKKVCPGVTALVKDMNKIVSASMGQGGQGAGQDKSPMFENVEKMSIDMYGVACKHQDTATCLGKNEAVCNMSASKQQPGQRRLSDTEGQLGSKANGPEGQLGSRANGPEGQPGSRANGPEGQLGYDPTDAETLDCFCNKCPGAMAASIKFQYYLIGALMSGFSQGFGEGPKISPEEQANQQKKGEQLTCNLVTEYSCMRSHGVCAKREKELSKTDVFGNQSKFKETTAMCATKYPPPAATTRTNSSDLVTLDDAFSFAVSPITLYLGIFVSFSLLP